jgi:hypothetical protein
MVGLGVVAGHGDHVGERIGRVGQTIGSTRVDDDGPSTFGERSGEREAEPL